MSRPIVSKLVLIMTYVTVSAKISRELKRLLDKYKIKPGPIIRRALEEEVKRCILADLEEKVKKLSDKLVSIPDDEIAKIIREDRRR